MPPPMELKYEKVMAPFLLLHVNRYAGRALESEADAADPTVRGALLVKGLKSMWRQSAPLVSTVLHSCLERVLMHDDPPGAVAFAEQHIHRLLSGRVELNELIMTVRLIGSGCGSPPKLLVCKPERTTGGRMCTVAWAVCVFSMWVMTHDSCGLTPHTAPHCVEVVGWLALASTCVVESALITRY